MRIWTYIVILVVFLTLVVGSRIRSIHSPAVPKVVPPSPPEWLLTPRAVLRFMLIRGSLE